MGISIPGKVVFIFKQGSGDTRSHGISRYIIDLFWLEYSIALGKGWLILTNVQDSLSDITWYFILHNIEGDINGIVQDCSDSIANPLEFLQSCTKCKTVVSPLLTHWRYCSLALSHQYDMSQSSSLEKIVHVMKLRCVFYVFSRMKTTFRISERDARISGKPVVTMMFQDIWSCSCFFVVVVLSLIFLYETKGPFFLLHY